MLRIYSIFAVEHSCDICLILVVFVLVSLHRNVGVQSCVAFMLHILYLSSLFILRHVCWACMLSVSDTLLYIHPLNSHSTTASHGTMRWCLIQFLWKAFLQRRSFPTPVTFRNVSWPNAARWWSDIHLSTEPVCCSLKEILWWDASANFLRGRNHNVHTRVQTSPTQHLSKDCLFLNRWNLRAVYLNEKLHGIINFRNVVGRGVFCICKKKKKISYSWL